MAAPQQTTSSPAPLQTPPVVVTPAEQIQLAHTRRMAATARERLAEIPGVRVLGSEVAGATASVRLVIDVAETGRDARDVAEAMALRGMPLECRSERVLVAALGPADAAEGTHERVAPALLIALWSVPAGR